MPSFDIVSEVNQHELSNAVDQTNRDISGRFDFKDTGAKVEQEKDALVLHAQNEFQIKQMKDILHQRLAKRSIDIGVLEEEKLLETGQRAQQRIKVRQGIDKDMARKIVGLVKDSKLKVQASVQGDQVRITGKKRDDLQSVIAFLRGTDIGLPVQFQNFRD